MATLTKADLSEELFSSLNLSKKDSKEMVENLFNKIRAIRTLTYHMKLDKSTRVLVNLFYYQSLFP